MSNLNVYDKDTWFECIWDALHESKYNDSELYQDEWDDICTAMAWLKESLLSHLKKQDL